MRDDLRTRGYTVVRNLVGVDGLGVLRDAVAQLEAKSARMTRSTDDFILEAPGVGGWVAWQQGSAPAHGTLRSVSRAHQFCPELADLAATLATRQLGPATGAQLDLINTFLWAKPAVLGSEKPWHQDMAFAPEGFTQRYRNVVTAWVAVDPATPENGCLQFVPGSHLTGILPHIGDDERTGGQPRKERAVEPHVDPDVLTAYPEPAAVPLDPGSAVVFDGMIVHRSAANESCAPRRAVSFVYAIPRGGTHMQSRSPVPAASLKP